MKFLPIVDPLGEIRRVYFATTRATIDRDFETALELLKAMDNEDERSRATVFMHGLAQMRSDWSRGSQTRGAGKAKRNPARKDGSGGGSKPNG
jgi:hypothetical protein